MTRHKHFLVILLLLFSAHLFAENISDSVYNYSLDIPEGYELTEIADVVSFYTSKLSG